MRVVLRSMQAPHQHQMRYVACILLGFGLGVFATYCFVNFARNTPRPTPILAQPKSITVFLHPWGGYEAVTTKAVRIPIERQDEIYRRLVPDTFYGNIYEHVSPLVAEVVIEHLDQTETRVLVREGGHNPAIVSVDGVNYFYAKNEPDVHAGAIELIRIAAEIAHEQQIQSKTD